MMRATRILLFAALAVGLLACEAKTDKSGSGGVRLSVSDFDGLPVQISVTVATSVGMVQIEDLEVVSVVTDPTGTSSALMDVEIQSYEVIYTRADSGSRLPPKLTRGLFGTVPAGGTMDIEGLPILTLDQLTHEPLRDLSRVGFDTETGSDIISLNCHLTFFGRTLSGDAVQTTPAKFTVDFSV